MLVLSVTVLTHHIFLYGRLDVFRDNLTYSQLLLLFHLSAQIKVSLYRNLFSHCKHCVMMMMMMMTIFSRIRTRDFIGQGCRLRLLKLQATSCAVWNLALLVGFFPALFPIPQFSCLPSLNLISPLATRRSWTAVSAPSHHLSFPSDWCFVNDIRQHSTNADKR